MLCLACILYNAYCWQSQRYDTLWGFVNGINTDAWSIPDVSTSWSISVHFLTCFFFSFYVEDCNPLWSSQHWTTLSCCCLGYSPDIHLNLFTVIGYLSPPKSGGRVITCNVILYNPSNPLLKCSFLAVLILFMYQLFAASQQLKGHPYYGLNVFLSIFFFSALQQLAVIIFLWGRLSVKK